jgi:hypothetical protein
VVSLVETVYEFSKHLSGGVVNDAQDHK